MARINRKRQLARFNERMEAIPKAVRDVAAPAAVKSAEEIANRMRSLAPEDSGDLKRSILVTGPGERTPPYSQPGGSDIVGPLSAKVTVGNDDVRYPHLIEYGTATATAQPFFWPAVRLLKKKAQRRIRRAIAKAVREGWQS